MSIDALREALETLRQQASEMGLTAAQLRLYEDIRNRDLAAFWIAEEECTSHWQGWQSTFLRTPMWEKLTSAGTANLASNEIEQENQQNDADDP